MSPRVRALLFTGFASGLPLLLSGATLSARLTNAGVALETIGLYALVGLPYSLKVVWAPLLDRYSPPWLGRRRGWMVLFQLLSALGIAALGAADPRSVGLPVIALALAAASASLDVVSDAYNADVLPPAERATGGATFVAGYRIAMLLAGGLALGLADRFSWRGVYFGFAAAMLIGVVATLRAPEPAEVAPPASLTDAVVAPLATFFRRPGAGWVLAFVAFYKIGDTVVEHLVTPFLLGLGFGNAEIGAVNQGVGLAATIAGTLLGAVVVRKLGLYRSLLLFGVLRAVTNLGYSALAFAGRDHTLLLAAVTVDNLCTGLATAASVGFLLSLCDPRFSATQMALFTSVASLAGRLVAAGSGFVAVEVGWPLFFLGTTLLAAPGLTILVFLRRRGVENSSLGQ